MMYKALSEMAGREDYAALYVSLRSLHTQTENEFFEHLRRRIVTKVGRYYQAAAGARRLPTRVQSANELKQFLMQLTEKLNLNVALFLDDLEAVSEYVHELLLVLRAAYESTATPTQFVAVVCSSNGLARTVSSSTSPFHPISQRVHVRDLTVSESRAMASQLFSQYRVRGTRRVFQVLYEQTAGDRFLVWQLARRLPCKPRANRSARAGWT